MLQAAHIHDDGSRSCETPAPSGLPLFLTAPFVPRTAYPARALSESDVGRANGRAPATTRRRACCAAPGRSPHRRGSVGLGSLRAEPVPPAGLERWKPVVSSLQSGRSRTPTQQRRGRSAPGSADANPCVRPALSGDEASRLERHWLRLTARHLTAENHSGGELDLAAVLLSRLQPGHLARRLDRVLAGCHDELVIGSGVPKPGAPGSLLDLGEQRPDQVEVPGSLPVALPPPVALASSVPTPSRSSRGTRMQT